MARIEELFEMDDLSAQCADAKERLRQEFLRAKRIAAVWEPRPMPKEARRG